MNGFCFIPCAGGKRETTKKKGKEERLLKFKEFLLGVEERGEVEAKGKWKQKGRGPRCVLNVSRGGGGAY
jgi:hypothetical protein